VLSSSALRTIADGGTDGSPGVDWLPVGLGDGVGLEDEEGSWELVAGGESGAVAELGEGRGVDDGPPEQAVRHSARSRVANNSPGETMLFNLPYPRCAAAVHSSGSAGSISAAGPREGIRETA
jgi:hypothetical protein